jgi:hypothetical protein
VSPIKTNRTTAGIAAVSARAKDAAAQAVPMGKRAGTTAVHGARQGAAGAKEWAAPRVQDAVREAREWAAPRLEDAADAVTASVAPKVSSALRATASQVRPGSPGQSGLRKLLDWRWLLGLGALVAAAGTTAAVAIRRRYASATADAEDAAENAADPEAGTQAQADDPAAEAASVNGQVTTNKR